MVFFSRERVRESMTSNQYRAIDWTKSLCHGRPISAQLYPLPAAPALSGVPPSCCGWNFFSSLKHPHINFSFLRVKFQCSAFFLYNWNVDFVAPCNCPSIISTFQKRQSISTESLHGCDVGIDSVSSDLRRRVNTVSVKCWRENLSPEGWNECTCLHPLYVS